MDYVPFNRDEYNRWVSDAGDLTHRLNYPLNKNSIIVDAGGFMGYWTENMNIIHGCQIYILEPLKNYYDDIVIKFKDYDNIIPINSALLNKNEKTEMSIKGDSSSLFDPGDNMETIESIDVKNFMEDYKLEHIDVIKINIEGSEYDLLDRIIELNLHHKIDNFQIQFHRFIEGCDQRRLKIQNELSKTHNCTWNYDWIWENWQIK
jgi:FkbM family methyltransferase